MPKNINNFIRITLPLAVEAQVQPQLDAVTHAAGGTTITEARGQWFDGDGVRIVERVVVYQWNFGVAGSEKVDDLCRNVVTALFQAGEQAVMREDYGKYGDEYRAFILYSDVPKQVGMFDGVLRRSPDSSHIN